jgi:hypothetical protein
MDLESIEVGIRNRAGLTGKKMRLGGDGYDCGAWDVGKDTRQNQHVGRMWDLDAVFSLNNDRHNKCFE